MTVATLAFPSAICKVSGTIHRVEGTPPLRGAGCRRTATDEVSRFALGGVETISNGKLQAAVGSQNEKFKMKSEKLKICHF